MCADGSPMESIYFQPDDGPAGTPYTSCPSDEADDPDPGPGVDDILRAFRAVPLPESVLIVEPPRGETLVNFETNFLTVAQPFDRRVTLLGHVVDLRVRPTRFEWHFGDGVERSTTDPGDRYPHLVVTHEYGRKGTVRPSVDTVWGADYRIDGGAWAPVPDTVTMNGAAQSLRVRTATPVLVGS